MTVWDIICSNHAPIRVMSGPALLAAAMCPDSLIRRPHLFAAKFAKLAIVTVALNVDLAPLDQIGLTTSTHGGVLGVCACEIVCMTVQGLRCYVAIIEYLSGNATQWLRPLAVIVWFSEASVAAGLPFAGARLEVTFPRCIAVDLNDDEFRVKVDVRCAHGNGPLVVMFVPYHLDIVSFIDLYPTPHTKAIDRFFRAVILEQGPTLDHVVTDNIAAVEVDWPSGPILGVYICV